jgi:amidohydrolase
MSEAVDAVLGGLAERLPDLRTLYTDLHAHPELSGQETRTARQVVERLRSAGYEVADGVGGTGVVGVLRNGDGPTVMLRADMDALPVQEGTGLPYASTATGTDAEGSSVPVMHACGHDMHVIWLAGASALFAAARQAWHGTLMVVFQPAEETANGSQSMIDDGLVDRFPKPDVVLGQHVLPGPAGQVTCGSGVVTSAGDSLAIRLFGRGAHGSMPEASVDPVVMAAATVMRLQTIVSREVATAQSAVVTVGALQAGTKENVIPEEALIKLNVRTFDEQVRQHVLDAIKRIVNAESAASGAPRPPEFRQIDHYPATVNDPDATRRVADAFTRQFDPGAFKTGGRTSASEDFGNFGAAWQAPSVFWFVGGTDPAAYAKAEQAGRVAQDIPTNHSAAFAPVLEATLPTGVEALVAGALAWLAV